MSDFEEIFENKEKIDESELFEDMKETEDEQTVSLDLIDVLDNMQLDQALYFVGLIGAQIRKAPNPNQFASMYSSIMTTWLKIIGFEQALKMKLSEVKLNPNFILIVGVISIFAGVVLIPKNASLPSLPSLDIDKSELNELMNAFKKKEAEGK